jgi:hypothetical protein
MLPQLNGTVMPYVVIELLRGLPEGDRRSHQERIAKNCAAVAFFGTCVRFVLGLLSSNLIGSTGENDTVRKIFLALHTNRYITNGSQIISIV